MTRSVRARPRLRGLRLPALGIAILALGRMRFFAGAGGRAGDQRTAERLLKQLASDGDPVIRTAAETALELTLEQYRMLS